MKLLGWMHRKFRQNNNETLKEFSIGNSCTCLTGQPSLDDLNCYPKTNYCGKPLSKLERDNHTRNSFSSLGAERVEEDYLEEDSSAVLNELFHGFLAIGTLGTEPVIADPATPTFSISVDHIAEKETEVTENELKIINDELEKVLGAEARDESCNVSSGRNSHVSAGRSSHCSTITLGGKPIEGAESNGNGTIIGPLQSYLFGSAIGFPEPVPQAKKEHRMSLGELFQKTKLEENSGTKCDRGEKRAEKETDKSAVYLMKKMLKKKMLHASSRSPTTGSEGTIDSASAETRLHKILQKFHRKVHPESSTVAQKSRKLTNNEMKTNITYVGARNSGGLLSTFEDITIYPEQTVSKESIGSFKSQCNPYQFTLSSGDLSGSRECWVKTDADYAKPKNPTSSYKDRADIVHPLISVDNRGEQAHHNVGDEAMLILLMLKDDD
ncbi:hypothetical protein Fot_04700 [Forsythia ovata]|uniref:LAZY1 n=1 Tax=Forsythia ovata TaxID=205694 RepID=A0ABD1XDB3_9LAMI